MTYRLMERTKAITDREQALEFLLGRIDYERTNSIPYRSRQFKLDRMRTLLVRLGNPHDVVPIIHVAGTKGKGSTATLIAAALTSSGYRTGLYTSPHLDRLEERFAIDGLACSAEHFIDLTEEIRPIVERLDLDASQSDDESGPTYFELTTALALLHFARRQVDIAVLEVGLGGRLDSTNVCQPLVSVITSISFDHTKQLGNTLSQIAGEKAGIIKPGIPVVSGVTQTEPRDVIRATCDRQQSELRERGRDFDAEYHGLQPSHLARFSFRQKKAGESRELNDIDLGLIGRHQTANAAVAIATLDVLRRGPWRISDQSIRDGFASARCPARIEVVQSSPCVVIDAAHNVASIDALAHVLENEFVQPRRVLIFATSMDKDAQGMLKRLLPRFQRVIFTRYFTNPRSVEPRQLLEFANEIDAGLPADGREMTVAPDPQSAWDEAAASAKKDDLICVTGSFFLAAEIRQRICR